MENMKEVVQAIIEKAKVNVTFKTNISSFDVRQFLELVGIVDEQLIARIEAEIDDYVSIIMKDMSDKVHDRLMKKSYMLEDSINKILDEDNKDKSFPTQSEIEAMYDKMIEEKSIAIVKIDGDVQVFINEDLVNTDMTPSKDRLAKQIIISAVKEHVRTRTTNLINAKIVKD